MPAMSPGAHTIELASFVVDGTTVAESARSAPLRVTVTGATAGAPPPSPAPPAALPSWLLTTSDGADLRLDTLSDELEAPTAIALAPDGRVFVAEQEGRVRVVRNGVLDPLPAITIHEVLMTSAAEGGLLAIALDAQFDRTHFLYAVYTVSGREGTRRFRLVRYREVDGRSAHRRAGWQAVRGVRRGARHRAHRRARVVQRQDPASQHRRHDTDRPTRG
jgi:glucose/arabinose dehydrogenase